MKTLMAFVFSGSIGGIFGLTFGLLVNGSFGWLIAVLMFLFSLDVLLNGTKDGM